MFLTWIIHESRLLQMRGTGYAAVVVLRKCHVTKHEAGAVRSARPKGKECRHRGKEVHGKRVECYAEGKINVNGRYHEK